MVLLAGLLTGIAPLTQAVAADTTGGVVTSYTGTGISFPTGITAGTDGALWFTNRDNNSIGRITTAGAVTNYTGTGISEPEGITTGPDGALWFTSLNNTSIGRITTAGDVTSYNGTGISGSQGITAGPDGALWFIRNGSNSIGRITTAGVVTSNYTGTGINGPEGITAGPDGALWFTNKDNNSIGRITTAGVVTNYTGTGISFPHGITAGPDGALWFTNTTNNSIGRITTAGAVTNYTGTGISEPVGITAGPDGALWFTNNNNFSIGRITTAGVVTSYTGAFAAWGITAGPDGALWFTNSNNSIGRITAPSTPSPLAITTTSLPNGTVGSTYGAVLKATGGTVPYTWSISSGALPTGLSLDPTNGSISGTPTTIGTSGFTVKATDSSTPAETATATLSITNGIRPGSCPATSLASTLANFAAEICRIITDQTLITHAQTSLSGLASQFPSVHQTSPGVWEGPSTALLQVPNGAQSDSALAAAAAEAVKLEVEDAADLVGDIGKELIKEKFGGGASDCGLGKLLDSVSENVEGAVETQHASDSLNQGGQSATTQADVVGSVVQGGKDFVKSALDLIDALKEASECAAEARAEVPVLLVVLDDDLNELTQADALMSLNPLAGWTILVNTNLNTNIVAEEVPSAFSSAGALPSIENPTGLIPGNIVIPSALNGTLSLPALPPSLGVGSSLQITGAGFAASQPVVITGNSAPVVLGVATTDSTGVFSKTVQIPAQMTAGTHEIEALGLAPDGSLRLLDATITVTAARGAVPAAPCIGTVSGTIHGGLTVPAGVACKLLHAVVDGTVTVGNGAVFEADASTLNGGVVGVSPTGIALCGTRVNGSVSAQSVELPILIGAAGLTCGATTVTGTVSPAPPF